MVIIPLLVWSTGCASMSSAGSSGTGSGGGGTGGGGTGGGSGGGGGGSNSTDFLYAANLLSANLSGYQVNSDGTLSPLKGFPVSTAQNPRSLATGGNYLLLANGFDNNGNNGQIALFKIDSSTGKLSRSSTFATSPSFVALTPKGDFAYDSEAGIAAYSTAGGKLKQLPNSPFTYVQATNGNVNPLTPDHLLIDPNGQLMYASFYPANFRTPYGDFGVIPINSDGSLGGFSSGSPVQSCNIAGGLAVDAASSGNRFVYESCGDPNWDTTFNILEFTVDPATGAISGNSSFTGTATSGGLATGVAVDATGRWLVGLDVNNDEMYILAINPATGVLTQAQTVATGHRPNSVTFDSSGKFLYVSNGDYPLGMTGGDNTISAYSFDASSGTATPLSGSPYVAGASVTSLTLAH
jgi:6-phosphogluconolactonase (cycloisomerase 2 family)